MKTTQHSIVLLLIFMYTTLSYAQNIIDSAGGGGFVALIPDGNVDPATGFPTGTPYEGDLIYSNIWQNATQYRAQTGEGYLFV
jgi:hypothetical protein